jgi:hypothetical protein
LDLKSEHHCAILRVGYISYLVEGDVVLIIFLRDGHSVNLVTHALGVLLEPIEWDDVGVNFTGGSNQVGDHGDQPWREARFGEKVHLYFFYNDELVLKGREVE